MKNALLRILQYTGMPRAKLMFAVVCSILNKICDIVPEILIGIAIDVVVNQHNSIVAKMGIANPVNQLYAVGALTAVLWILESVFEYLYTITWRQIAQSIQHMVRLQMYARIQDADFTYLESKTSGQLLNTLQEDVSELEQFLSQGPNAIIQLTVNIIVMGTIFMYLSPVLALVAFIPIPFVIGIAYYFQHKMAQVYTAVRETMANLTSHIAHRLHGIATIKSYTMEQYELEKLRVESNKYQDAHHTASMVSARYIPLVRMAVMAGFIGALIVGGLYALHGYIPINWYAALVFLTQRFLWPFTEIATITDTYEKSLAGARRVLEILETRPTITSGSQAIHGTVGAVTFKDVSFGYTQNSLIFNKLNITIPAGKTVAFVGSTGSGKSTMVKLLLRFYEALSGTISLDGNAIKTLSLANLRQAIGLVSQEVYIVDGTIADNIVYGTLHATRDDVIAAAKMAQAHDFIAALPQGYDTVVREHGKNLSGGQRQRLAIARAILKKAPILIFDEATSAVDNETEAAIQKSITTLSRDHTIIIIAHRLSTVRNADMICVLDKGALIESGTHDELVHKNGAYARLYALQQ